MFARNKSAAVRAARQSPIDALDFWPTPPWATRALLYEPGLWSELLGDVYPYGYGQVYDFLPGRHGQRGLYQIPVVRPDWIITNPPFNLGLEFAVEALKQARTGVALLLRSTWSEGIRRHSRLFAHRPPTVISIFTERVNIVPGRLDRYAKMATSYSWFVWHRDCDADTRYRWIPPCRGKYERDEDYAAPAGEVA